MIFFSQRKCVPFFQLPVLLLNEDVATIRVVRLPASLLPMADSLPDESFKRGAFLPAPLDQRIDDSEREAVSLSKPLFFQR